MPTPLVEPPSDASPPRRPFLRRAHWRIGVIILAVVAVLAVVLLAANRNEADAPAGATQTAAIPTADAATGTGVVGDLVRGQAIFAANCAVCHGLGGKGDGPAAAGLNPAPVDFTSAVHRGHRREDQISWVTNGLPPSAMPGFGTTLSPADIAAVVDYIRSLGAAAASDGSVDSPDPALCTIDPTDPASLRSAPVDAPAPAPTPPPVVGPDFAWPQGEPASREEIDGVTSALRLFVACGNAGDQRRRLSLYSRGFIGPQFDAMGADDWQRLLDFASTAPAPLTANQWAGIQSLGLFRRLPDGRVGAYASIVDPVNHPHQTDVVLIFVRQGDRWLIDEIHADPDGVLLAAQTPEPTAVSAPLAAAGTSWTVGGLTVTVSEIPAGSGPGTVGLSIVDAQGRPVDDATVGFVVGMSSMPMGVTTGTANPLGSGKYEVQGSFAMAGRWEIRGVIQRPGAEPIAFSFDIEIPSP